MSSNIIKLLSLKLFLREKITMKGKVEKTRGPDVVTTPR